MDDLIRSLTNIRRRLRLRDSWLMVQRTLPIAAGACLAILLAGRVFPIENLALLSLVPLPVWLLAVVGYALFQRFPLMRAARRADEELDLRERLSTALAFQSQASPEGLESQDPVVAALILRQRQDALHSATAIHPAQDFPLRWTPRPLAAAGLILAAALVSALLPNPMDAVLAEREAVRQEAARQAERIEEFAQQIEQNQELSPEEQEELLRQLRELAERLRANRGDLEQALADVSNLEKELQARADPNALAQAATLEALAQQLENLTGKTREPNQSAAEAAAAALAELAAQMEQMDSTEQQQAAQALAQMAAQAAQAGDQQLAQALAAMAQAMQAGDAQAANQSAQGAQAAMQATDQQLTDQQALQQALAQLQNSQQQLAQASQAAVAQAQPGAQGQPGQSGQPGQQPGQGPGNNPGSNPGAGQNSGSNAGTVGGGGSNANTLPPNQGGRPNVNPQGSAADVPVGELNGQVYAPLERPPGSGEEVFIPGQDTGQGETTTTEGQSNLPGQNNPALVPYNQVYYNYLNAANQAMQNSYIPNALAEYVKTYFTQLAPR